MISAKMAEVNARVARARAFLAHYGWPSPASEVWAVREAWRDLRAAERRQRVLRAREVTS